MNRLIAAIDEALKSKGLSDAAASELAVGHKQLLKNIRNRKNAQRLHPIDGISRLLDVLDIDVKPAHETENHILPTPGEFSSKQIPVRGFGKCSLQGWTERGEGLKDLGSKPAPYWLDDPKAFWVMALGQSMIPEGIRSGDYCLVSPSEPVVEGSRVYVKAHPTGEIAIKRVVDLDGDIYHLRGWLDLHDGKQEEYRETRPAIGISEIYTIVADYRGDPANADNPARFIPDPKDALEHRQDIFPVDLLHEDHKDIEADVPDSLGFDASWLKRHNVPFGSVMMVVCDDNGVSASIPMGSVTLVNTSVKLFSGKGIYLVKMPEGGSRLRYLEEVRGTGYLIRSDSDEEALLMSEQDVRNGAIIGRTIWYGTEVL